MKKEYILVVLLFLSILPVYCQSLIGAAEYLVVENRDNFKAIQEKWVKIQKSRLELKEISGWAIYEVSSRLTAKPHNYVRITYYDSFLKMGAAISDKAINKAYSGLSKDAWKAMVEEEKSSCKIADQGVFYREISCSKGLDKYSVYFRISEINVNPGMSKEYLSMQENYYKPVYDELIEKKNCTAWSIWAKWTGQSETFQFVTAEGFRAPDNIESLNIQPAFQAVHPGQDFVKNDHDLEEMMKLNNSEVWKVVYRVVP